MPIIVPDSFSSSDILQSTDGINVMRRSDAGRQDIRPQEFVLLNLMPSAVKERTERQIARLLGHTSLHVHLTLLHANAPEEAEIASSYETWERIANRSYDGLIVTGAPLGHVEWNDVRHWDRLRRIIDWSRTNVTARVFLCWGAMAALKHLHGLERRMLPQKAFGIFPHGIAESPHPLTSGFDDEFHVPVSRHTEVPIDRIAANERLHILSSSEKTGAYIVADDNGRDVYVLNHPEYGKRSLDGEYKRDVTRGLSIEMPENYYPGNDPDRPPTNRWRAHARLLVGNLLDQTYQRTPFDVRDILDLPENIPYRASSDRS